MTDQRSQGPEGTLEPTSGEAPTPGWGAETERETMASDEGDRDTIGPQNDLSGGALGEGIPGDVRGYPDRPEDDAPSRAD